MVTKAGLNPYFKLSLSFNNLVVRVRTLQPPTGNELKTRGYSAIYHRVVSLCGRVCSGKPKVEVSDSKFQSLSPRWTYVQRRDKTALWTARFLLRSATLCLCFT